MMAMTFPEWLSNLWTPAKNKTEKITCYHCGEKSFPKKTLYVVFNGTEQPVCCHGCLAVLKTIEKNHLIPEYLQTKAEREME
ncbi:heavy metal translocating P-type ATPase metal-binding domain-containing protein [Undibacterium griseum]|nr:heavy metal translocating P-type ATPase metal-binding domain-containing protein [Undibacterium griseum]